MGTFLPKVHDHVAAAAPRRLGAEDAENVLLFHDEVLLAVQLDLAPGGLAEEDAVAFFDCEGQVLALVGDPTGPHRDDRALLGLLLGTIGDDDGADLLAARFDALDEDDREADAASSWLAAPWSLRGPWCGASSFPVASLYY
jgi:hypothetical protein